jgi:uncharacterized protein (DUF1697 family)
MQIPCVSAARRLIIRPVPALSNYVALLRAANLAGHNQVGMSDLRELLANLGFKGARSLLQSGNLIFQSAARASSQLELLLENAAKTRLGLETDFFVRTASEWSAVIAGNPFPEEATRDPSHLLVVFLKDAPGRRAVAALQAAITGHEIVRARGRHAYIVYPDGIGRSRVTNALIEKTLGTRGTGRNWNTVLKLGALSKA